MSNNIMIDDPAVIDFFRDNEFIDPNSFIRVAIERYKNEAAKKDNISIFEEEKIEFSKEELMVFYDEYKFFLNQKSNIDNYLKESYKECHNNLNRIKFSMLESMVSKHLNINTPALLCDICGVFKVATVKGLVTHKRKCSQTHKTNESCDSLKNEAIA